MIGYLILPNFFPNIVPAKMGMMLVYIKLILGYHIMISIQQKNFTSDFVKHLALCPTLNQSNT